MADVRWHSKFELMVERLTAVDEPSGRKLFETNKELIKFAAMIGYKNKLKGKPDAKNAKTIPMRIFESTRDEELIFLVALLTKKDANVLRKDKYQDNEAEVLKIFEEYANGGLQEIQKWFADAEEGSEKRKLLEKITKCFKEKLRVSDQSVEF